LAVLFGEEEMAIKKANENLKLLEEKCRMLEGQCSEYVKELEKTK